MRSYLETYEIASGEVRTVLATDLHIEAPNWDPWRRALVVNAEGRLFRVSLQDGALQEVETELRHLNNDHGLMPDGARLVVSENVKGRGECDLYPARRRWRGDPSVGRARGLLAWCLPGWNDLCFLWQERRAV